MAYPDAPVVRKDEFNWPSTFLFFFLMAICFYRASGPLCVLSNGWVSHKTHQCFIPIAEEMTYHDAEAYCKREYAGHLASIHNDGDAKALNDHIRKVLPSVEYYHIGLNKYACSDFMYQDNSAVDFKPEGFELEAGSCTYIRSEDRRWFEGVCLRKKSFVCSKPDTFYDRLLK